MCFSNAVFSSEGATSLFKPFGERLRRLERRDGMRRHEDGCPAICLTISAFVISAAYCYRCKNSDFQQHRQLRFAVFLENPIQEQPVSYQRSYAGTLRLLDAARPRVAARGALSLLWLAARTRDMLSFTRRTMRSWYSVFLLHAPRDCTTCNRDNETSTVSTLRSAMRAERRSESLLS